MINETEIKKAARLHYIGSIEHDPESDFYAGAKWAIQVLSAENAALRAENAELRDALKEYGRHKNGCWVPCNCGFDDALDEAIGAALAAKGE